MRLTKFLPLFLLFTFQASAQSFAGNCLSVFGKRRFPKVQVDDATGKSHFQFGFEAEYTMKDSEELLKLYMPDPELSNLTKKEWLAKSHEEKVRYIDSNKTSLFPDYRNEGKFVRIDPDEGYDFLPESFLLDSGNFELRVGPFDSLEEWRMAYQSINEKANIGSMQTSVSVSELSFFAGPTPVKDNMAYFKALHEHDTLEKLSNGVKKLEKSPDTFAAQSFDHPWLGPETAQKEASLFQHLNRNHLGDYGDIEKIGARIDSHKFISGTVYRPDVAPKAGRIINEIRDCHKNPSCLEERVQRIITFHTKGKDPLRAANQFVPFNRAKSFRTLLDASKEPSGLLGFGRTTEVGGVLKELFPNYWKKRAQAPEALDKFLNFSYPMRDWSGHIKVLSEDAAKHGIDLSSQIAKAQKKYVDELKDISKSFRSGTLKEIEAKKRVQAALANFSEDSGLYKSMKSWLLRPQLRELVP